MDHFEKAIRVSEVFKQNEVIDVIGITKGKGFKGRLYVFVKRFVSTSNSLKVLHSDGVRRNCQGKLTRG